MILYRLEHHHKTDGYDQVLYLGLFDSVSKVNEAIDKLIKEVGFKSHPRNAFKIMEVNLDQIYWEEGFNRVGDEDVEI